MTRIWDTFLFNDELDLLETRLTELDQAVWRWVLAEADMTFQGSSKPLHYLENAARFAPWADRIIRVDASQIVRAMRSPWGREAVSRDALRQGLAGFTPGADVLLHGDADEIPRASAVLDVRPGEAAAFSQRMHPVAVNLRHPHDWPGTVAAPVPGQSFSWLRAQRTLFPALADAGWHFTWLGGPGAMRAKVRQFSHDEAIGLVDDRADQYWAEGRCLADGVLLERCEIDGSWPQYMQERHGPASWYWKERR